MSASRPHRSPAATRPEPFLLSSVVPHLLSPFPTRGLPPTHLSRSAQEAIHFLSIDPDNEAYWTLGRKDDEVVVRRRELIEAGNLDDLVLSPPHYSHDPEELRCLVTLSLPYATSNTQAASLGVVLVWEDSPSPLVAMHAGDDKEDDTRPGWTFLELQALDSAPEEVTVPAGGGKTRRIWHASVAEAQAASAAPDGTAAAAAETDAATRSLNGVDGGSPGSSNGTDRPAPLDLASLPQPQYSFDPHGEHDEDDESYRDPAFGGRPATTTNKKAPVADMADGEGTTPGAYGSPNDFWANWSDDEGTGNRSGPRSAIRTPTTREAEQEAADEAYWASYGGVDSVVGDDAGTREEQSTAETAGTSVPRTRTRRSSTVTPYRASSQQQQQPDFLTEANVQAASTASASVPARPPIPAQSHSQLSGFAYPLDVSALSERLTRAQSRGADSDDEMDVDLRLALEGIWRMYVGKRSSGLMDLEEIEEKKKRFERVVAGVLAADV
ncbi:hypothetical protein JCM10908_006423 [Rhodotorula pacifica]|uniref:uncharacterized protein n=1 Tax=Rhodotorula pacifica TaxID=1495444 RepID=UPI003171DEE6